jgi:phosphate acetyltransferase
MVPTSVGAGLTSASLGLMQALDTIGLKAGFLKPLRQDELNGPGPDRSTALVSSTLGLDPPRAMPQAEMERLLRQDRLDVLMEQVIELHDQRHPSARRFGMPELLVVEGVVPTRHGTYATQLNAQLAHALNARIILVGSGDTAEPRALAEQLDMHAQRLRRHRLRSHPGLHPDAHAQPPGGSEDAALPRARRPHAGR